MKSILNTIRQGLDHLPHCKGDRNCPRCGRLMCAGCTTEGEELPGMTTLPHELGHIGECLICSKMYKEEEIILHPPGWTVRR